MKVAAESEAAKGATEWRRNVDEAAGMSEQQRCHGSKTRLRASSQMQYPTHSTYPVGISVRLDTAGSVDLLKDCRSKL